MIFLQLFDLALRQNTSLCRQVDFDNDVDVSADFDDDSVLMECFGFGPLDLLPDSDVELAGTEPDDVSEVANEPVRELLVVDFVLKEI